MFYYLYEIKNVINNKIYVGVHKTKNMDDGYMGSGKVILSAIKKYGPENFTKSVLETFETSNAMFIREKEVVNEAFLARADTYNLRRGGSGGFDYVNKTRNSLEHNRKISSKRDYASSEYRQKLSSATKAALKLTTKRGSRVGRNATNGSTGKTWTLSKPPGLGNKNSQFGSMWITNGINNSKIKKYSPIPDGWNKGRTI